MNDWIFYLKIDGKLTSHFFEIDRMFKTRGVNLIPINLNDLLNLINGETKVDVVMPLLTITHFKSYMSHKKKIINMLLRNQRINLFIPSCFGKLNESVIYSRGGNYHFYRLPLPLSKLCDRIVVEIISNKKELRKWPGRSNAKPGFMSEI